MGSAFFRTQAGERNNAVSVLWQTFANFISEAVSFLLARLARRG
jgi:hypothetical protein